MTVSIAYETLTLNVLPLVPCRPAVKIDPTSLDELVNTLGDSQHVNVIITCDDASEDVCEQLECEEIELAQDTKCAAKAGVLHEEFLLYAHDERPDGTMLPLSLLDLYEAETLRAEIEKLVDAEKPVAAIYRADDNACVVRVWISDVGRLHKLRDTMLIGEFDVRLTEVLKKARCNADNSPHKLSVAVDRTHFAMR